MNLHEELQPKIKERLWFAQRVGWAGIALGLLLAIFGLFGSGVFSDQTRTASADGIEVTLEHPRFTRLRKPERLRIDVLAPNANGNLTLTLSRAFLDEVRINSVSPDPDSTSVGPDGSVYEWQVDDWSETLTVSVEYRNEDWRRVEGRVSVEAGDLERAISFTQFVFP